MDERSQEQYEAAMRLFEKTYGAREAAPLGVFAPGRSELAGNHTDHEGGPVIACAISCGIGGVAYPNGLQSARVVSEGFAPFEVALDALEPRPEEEGTSAAIVRGMAACLAREGRRPAGFDLALTSTIPAGGGLSSSAAFELAVGRAMEALWEGPKVSAVDLALMAQRVENHWFGKPCGLMDQLAIALGGVSFMDFARPEHPVSHTIDFSFEDHSVALVLVDVGAGHADLTSEYAAVPAEMQAVAQAFGKTRLVDVAPEAILAKLTELRASLGDRPVLRALHFFLEEELVDGRWEALKEEDTERFLALTTRSGASSAMFLQNVSLAGAAEQPAMVALALASLELGERGACRIHGGGFGGTIQAFVPLDAVDAFMARMDAALGEGSARRYAIEPQGARAEWL